MMMSKILIQRITATNESIFTGPGTNTFLIGKDDLTLVDPGPKINKHIEKLIELGAGKIKRILVTHTHRDHSPAAKVLGEMLNVPLMGRLLEKDDGLQDKTFKPDRLLKHGDLIKTNEYTIEVIHTPGHASNHLCYLIKEEKVLLTGDHIMNGSTVVIAHPDGSMKDYLSSLELLRKYNFNKIGPGHGDFLVNPMDIVDWIIEHRLERERKVMSRLKLFSSVTSEDLVESVYDDVDSKLHPIAIWSLEAHLHKLIEDGIVTFNSTNKTWSIK
tara:strand:+ start:2278 stop:3093 length:816 start_codon:yes stop_codon:yes gene_type:complete